MCIRDRVGPGRDIGKGQFGQGGGNLIAHEPAPVAGQAVPVEAAYAVVAADGDLFGAMEGLQGVLAGELAAEGELPVKRRKRKLHPARIGELGTLGVGGGGIDARRVFESVEPGFALAPAQAQVCCLLYTSRCV